MEVVSAAHTRFCLIVCACLFYTDMPGLLQHPLLTHTHTHTHTHRDTATPPLKFLPLKSIQITSPQLFLLHFSSHPSQHDKSPQWRLHPGSGWMRWLAP